MSEVIGIMFATFLGFLVGFFLAADVFFNRGAIAAIESRYECKLVDQFNGDAEWQCRSKGDE